MRIIIASLILISIARPVCAQRAEAWIVINAPIEWSEDRAVSAAVGTQIHVTGQAYHPRGIESVTVQGAAATIKPNAAGFVDFDAVFTVVGGNTDVAVVAKSKVGTIMTKTLHVVVETPQANVANQREFDAGSAVVRSLLLPGLGQFYTKQSGLGAVFLVAAAGATAAGIAVRESKVQCSDRYVLTPGADCPDAFVVRRYKTRPVLVPAVAGYVVLGVVSGLQAMGVAKHATTRHGDTNDGYRPALGMFVNESDVGIGLSWRF